MLGYWRQLCGRGKGIEVVILCVCVYLHDIFHITLHSGFASDRYRSYPFSYSVVSLCAHTCASRSNDDELIYLKLSKSQQRNILISSNFHRFVRFCFWFLFSPGILVNVCVYWGCIYNIPNSRDISSVLSNTNRSIY